MRETGAKKVERGDGREERQRVCEREREGDRQREPAGTGGLDLADGGRELVG